MKTFAEVIRIRCIENGLDLNGLLKRMNMKRSTFYDHQNRKAWTQVEVVKMSRILSFTDEDWEIFKEGG